MIDAAERVRPRLADDDDGGRHGAGRARLRHGRRRRRPAGDRHGAPPGRGRHRDRRAPGHQGAGRSRSAPSSSPSRTRSSSRPRPPAATPRRCPTEYQAKQAALVAAHIAKQDIVITTALIPGRPAPKLVTPRHGRLDEAGLGDRRPGGRARRQLSRSPSRARSSDAQRREDRRPPQRAGPPRRHGVGLYARNLFAFVETLVDKATKALAVKWDDELVKATCLTRDGAIVHPLSSPKPDRPETPMLPEDQPWQRDARPGCSNRRTTQPRAARAAAEAAQAYADQRRRPGSARRRTPRPAARSTPPCSAWPSSCWRSSSATTWSGR